MSEELKAAPKKVMSKGCLIGIIVIGILAVLVIGVMTTLYIYQDELLEWGLEKTTEMIAMEVKANLPDEFSEAEIDELFIRFREAVLNNDIEPTRIQNLATQFQKYLEDQKIDEDEARWIIEEVRKALEY